MLTINLISIFPDFFTGPLGLSIPKRAAEAGLVTYRCIDLRAFATDKHKTVDDAPFGGGPGMVMKPQPFFDAVESVGAKAPIVLLSPRGKVFSHADAERFAAGTELTLLCGHYKDVDQRVADHLATEEISLGDFVLSGGEPAALAIVDAVDGATLGEVIEFYDLPQGLLLEFRGPKGVHSVPFVDEFVEEVDREGRRIEVRLPDGLLES